MSAQDRQDRIVIATTEGPAEVERLSEEDPDVRSVVCLQGKALALPISPDYDAFVRRPVGVIEARFGHACYRLDVSAPISGGLSWQLGVFAAHALKAAGRLAEKGVTAGGGGSAQPATTYAVGCVTIGWPLTSTRRLGAVGVAWPA